MRTEERDPRWVETDSDGHQSYVQHLLQRLRDLEEQTRPSGGDATAQDKDWRATDALRLAGDLVDAVAGWAIDHQTGLALQNLRNVPPQPFGTENHSDYISGKAAVDAHIHELSGSSSAKEIGRDPSRARSVLANLLIHNQGALPVWLVQQSLSAIRAIELGDTKARHLFVTVGAGNKRSLAIHELELHALAFVAFRRAAFGHTEEKAAEEVAGALVAVTPNTLLNWGNRLSAKFGRLEVARRLAAARHAGESFAKKLSGDLEFADLDEGGFSNADLAKLSSQYRAELGRRGA